MGKKKNDPDRLGHQKRTPTMVGLVLSKVQPALTRKRELSGKVKKDLGGI